MNMQIPSVLLMLSCLALSSYGQPKPFPGLTSLKVDKATIHFQQNRCTFINRPSQNDPYYLGLVDVIKTRLIPSSPIEYLIQYSAGPSADPSFIIYRLDADSAVWITDIPCLNLYVPDNGQLYSSGHINNYFDTRRKYAVYPDSIVEVPQPFYFVGIETVTLKPVTLYSNIELTNVVAVLPTNSPTYVVASRDDYFLVRTPFGLFGWTRIEHGYGPVTFRDIYFAGD
jgi:hypothetical protein